LPAAPAPRTPAGVSVRSDGTYDAVPLAQDSFHLGVVQSRVRPVDASNPKPGLKENLAHMLELVDAAQGWGGRKDLLLFHEFPLTGFRSTWSRKELLALALEVPGEETEVLAGKAREHGCYLVFGTYAKDREWPDHILSLTTILGPDGSVVDRQWKARNIKGVFGGEIELMTTTIFDVLDAYVERYGEDAVLPVARTPIGNLATTSVQREPELVRALAMKGCEILLRTATGGFSELDVQAGSLYNGLYSAVANNSFSPGSPGVLEDAGGGGSAIYGPGGEALGRAASGHEQVVSARVPIAEFRRRHRQPVVHLELYRSVLERYVSKYPPNLFAGYLPSDLRDSARYLRDKSVWK